MHELSITENILKIVSQHAQGNDVKQVTDIYLVIGQLSSFVDEAIQFYWSILAKDTIAEEATLHFRRIPAEALCKDCGQQNRLSGDFSCPECGSSNIQIVAGEEFFIESIEVETQNQKESGK